MRELIAITTSRKPATKTVHSAHLATGRYKRFVAHPFGGNTCIAKHYVLPIKSDPFDRPEKSYSLTTWFFPSDCDVAEKLISSILFVEKIDPLRGDPITLQARINHQKIPPKRCAASSG